MPKRTLLPEPRRTPRFSGHCTFCRYPRLEDVAPENLPVDWALYGIPFDGGTTYRPGARFGPRAVREASVLSRNYNPDLDVLVYDRLNVVDGGDVPVNPLNLEATLSNIEKQVS